MPRREHPLSRPPEAADVGCAHRVGGRGPSGRLQRLPSGPGLSPMGQGLLLRKLHHRCGKSSVSSYWSRWLLPPRGHLPGDLPATHLDTVHPSCLWRKHWPLPKPGSKRREVMWFEQNSREGRTLSTSPWGQGRGARRALGTGTGRSRPRGHSALCSRLAAPPRRCSPRLSVPPDGPATSQCEGGRLGLRSDQQL